MPFDLAPFRPRFPWLTGDLQTLANKLWPPASPLGAASSERLRLPMDDGSGDTLLAMLDRPSDDNGGPALILIHGLTGCESSAYMLNTARHFLALGHPVLRLNLRAAGPSRPLCGDIYYAGRTQDLRAVLRLLPADLMARGLVAVGFSLGGNMLLKYLGEEGSAAPLRAAVSVSAPVDLSATCQHMMRPRNWLYHRYIIAAMKDEATAPGARLTAGERAAIMSSRNVWDYDDRFIAPRHGFAGAEDYYDKNKAVRFMPAIRTPTVVIAAADDPWIPISIYRGFDWASNKALVPLLADGGGHVGFHAAGCTVPWHDQAIARLLAQRAPAPQNSDYTAGPDPARAAI
ncbi:MAG TPA: alpha/beta fold hydrolase [Vineibacter sp.]|nr:alpha/beta fold hydrolase [Vineibacter sp.]